MALPHRVRRRGECRRKVAVLTRDATQPRLGAVGPYRLHAFGSLGSTNDEAMARLRAGDSGDLVVTAESQSGGRGRQGRAWQSPPGNLYASFALRLDVDPRVAPQLGFVAGVALADALSARLNGDRRLRLKWPNDVVFAGAKLAGMLLESARLADGRLGCVVGIGVNCRRHPEDLPYPATDLAVAGDPAPDPAAVLTDVAAAFASHLSRWQAGRHFRSVRDAWLAHAVDVGTLLTVKLHDRQVAGAFLGLGETGCLLLGEAGVVRHQVEAGDVFLADVADRFAKI